MGLAWICGWFYALLLLLYCLGFGIWSLVIVSVEFR